MNEERFKAGVYELSAEEAQLIYLRCTEGLSVRQMAERTGKDLNSVNRWLGRAYKALGIDGIYELNEQSCQWFRDIAGEPPNWNQWPPRRPQATTPPSPSETQEIPASTGTFLDRIPLDNRVLGIAAGVIVVILFIVLVISLINGREPAQEALEDVVQPTGIPTPASMVVENGGIRIEARGHTFTPNGSCLMAFELVITNTTDEEVVLNMNPDNVRFYDDKGRGYTAGGSPSRQLPECAGGTFNIFRIYSMAPGEMSRWLVSIGARSYEDTQAYFMTVENVSRFGEATWEFPVRD